MRAVQRKKPVKSGELGMNIQIKTAKKNIAYFAGHASRFNCGCTCVAMAWKIKKRNVINIGRITPAFPAHCESVSPSKPSHPSIHALNTSFPAPGMARYVRQIHPDSWTIPGPTEYWKKSATAIASVNNKTARFLPVVPSAVDPRHELHSDAAEVQQQYVAASESVEPILFVFVLPQNNK
mmetsp:Transcript_21798/g.33116  ORF Transcript_21798/g.33116 Transcript_21798/m.33116 type:complete len:180 (-) Transcript_21798:52-591(-)